MEQKGIRTEKLHIGYDSDLVRDISLAVTPGKIVTLIGPNGCGKSTLLKTLTGMLRERGGVVYLDGRDRKALRADEIARSMAMVMTHRVRPELMTCGEVVELGRYPHTGRLGILSEHDRACVRDAMSWCDVADLENTFFQNVSDGQRQRVMLARAICQEPGVLILDEPTSYLDIRHKVDILDMIRRLSREKKIAVLMSLHELEIAMRVSDLVVAMGEGEIVKTGTPAEVFREPLIRRLYHIEQTDLSLLGCRPWLPDAPGGNAGVHIGSGASGAKKPHVIMIQGTMSGAGKSVIAAGLCRIFAQDGYRTAPFKSQNMALNSFVTDEGLEMGRAQVMQAECARIRPLACMNPILLKPTDDRGSQVIVNGRVVGNMRAAEYFARKKEYMKDILDAYDRLTELADIIVVEGAGSPVELNLKKNDIVNMGLAEQIDAPVLLVGDIDRGGVFAQFAGTLGLLEPSERARVQGIIVNRFRGDRQLFREGERMLGEICGTDVLGVVPWMELELDDEDSLTDRFRLHRNAALDIAVIRLPHISNFTDLNPFAQTAEASVRYVSSADSFGRPDLVILPGSKNTIADLRWLKASGLAQSITEAASEQTPVIGICGGYQMLGRIVEDPEMTEAGGSEEGLDLLPVKTVLTSEKVRRLFRGNVEKAEGILTGLAGCPVEGYEIHMGQTVPCGEVSAFTSGDTGTCRENIYGTYVHGLFDKKEILTGVIDRIAAEKGVRIDTGQVTDYDAFKETQYEQLARTLRENLDMERIYEIMGVARHDD